MTGTRIGSYRILAKLGQGGMGEVYKAEDTRLRRLVAVKVLRTDRTTSDQGRLRFLQEARAASALNHPNIVQIYGLETQGDHDCIVMELVSGKTLAQLCQAGPIPIADALAYSRQMAAALAVAHAAGIVHRDIKPANVIVTASGVLKILDFGLAKFDSRHSEANNTITAGPDTTVGSVLGTPAYMSPEQAQGRAVDARSDIFSTGTVMYEMLTGKRAFEADSVPGVLTKVMRDTPRGIHEMRAEVPIALERIVNRCLLKDPALRYGSGTDLASDLAACLRPEEFARSTSRTRVVAAAVFVLIAMGVAGWLAYRDSRLRWTRNEAIPEIRRLSQKGDNIAAFDLAAKALQYNPEDAQLKEYWAELAVPVKLDSTPSGATLSYKGYGQDDTKWRVVGKTPLRDIRMPNSYLHLRIDKEGYLVTEGVSSPRLMLGKNIELALIGETPEGMIPVLHDAPWSSPGAAMPLPDFYIDRHEVTNRQFQAFVDRGGYGDRKYWRSLPAQKNPAAFEDRTGRPGPAGWELGKFPQDQPDYPVSGVSWYEAVAYCDFVGKALPTVHHWRKAADLGPFSDILLFSNFASAGPMRVGMNRGMSAFGAYDMAGNVKEWCWNGTSERKAILGGGWTEPSYKFRDDDAQDPLTRAPSYGLRCATYKGELPPAILAPVERKLRDYTQEKAVPDKTFAIYRQMYGYDKVPIEGRTESVADSNSDWRLEKVSYRAAYGDERIPAFLYLPKNAKPPYQTVLWIPGAYARQLPVSDPGNWTTSFSFLPRTGRAVLTPVYQGTYERRPKKPPSGPNANRDWTIQVVKDVSSSVDYLETRADLQGERVALYGESMGGVLGIICLAIEPRFRLGIISAAGLSGGTQSAEVDPLNFAPRVTMPVLMLNGRYDFWIPQELQQPLLRMLGTPPVDKRQVLSDSGHVPQLQTVIREVLNWLDRYLGPVTK